MDFSGSMTLFLDMTRTKSLDLANYLGYDNTYISKWLNGKRLPSKSAAGKILVKMSQFFAQEIEEKQLEESLRNVYPLPITKSKEAIARIILGILQEGYRTTEERRRREKSKGFDPYARNSTIVTGYQQAIDYFLQELYKHVALAKRDIVIHSTLNLFDILGIDQVRGLRMRVNDGVTLKLNMLLEPEVLQMTTATQLIDMAKFFARAEFIRAELFEKVDNTPNFIVIEGACSAVIIGDLKNPTLIFTDDATVQADIETKIKQWFTKPYSERWYKSEGRHDDLFYQYRHSVAQLFSPRVVPLLLPTRIIDKQSNLSLDARELITQQLEGIQHAAHYVHMHYLTSLKAIELFLENGEMLFTEGKVVLTPSERLDYLAKLLEPNDKVRVDILPLDSDLTRPVYMRTDIWSVGSHLLFERFTPLPKGKKERAYFSAVEKRVFGLGLKEIQRHINDVLAHDVSQTIVTKIRYTIDAYRELSVSECMKQVQQQIRSFETIKPLFLIGQ